MEKSPNVKKTEWQKAHTSWSWVKFWRSEIKEKALKVSREGGKSGIIFPSLWI